MPTSRLERLTRDLFRYYLPFARQQHNLRPDWLRWPVTGKRLEIDIYLADLKVGIEADGQQHGRPIKGLQRDFAAFERQQARDLWKVEECRRRGIVVLKLTALDLTAPRFFTHLRIVIEEGLASQPHEHIAHKLRKAQSNFYEYASANNYPQHLFAEAELLARRGVRSEVLPKRRKPGLWNLLKQRVRGQ